MARKKKLDKLSLDVIECEKAGFGCHYGRWKATQAPVAFEKKIPEGWIQCPQCGKWFEPKNGKRFCDIDCRTKSYSEKHAEYQRKYREINRQKEGAMA